MNHEEKYIDLEMTTLNLYNKHTFNNKKWVSGCHSAI